jgi:hypothetical protein
MAVVYGGLLGWLIWSVIAGIVAAQSYPVLW